MFLCVPVLAFPKLLCRVARVIIPDWERGGNGYIPNCININGNHQWDYSSEDTQLFCSDTIAKYNMGMTTSRIYPKTPRIAVGGVVIQAQKVLLVLRANPPAKGEWAIPGGSVNLGETLQTAVERELLEETGLVVKAGEVAYLFDSIHYDDRGQIAYHYVIIDLFAEPATSSLTVTAGDDALDVGWFTLSELHQSALPVSETTKTLLQKLMRNL
ncbi:NUDIX hydrolase [Anaerolineales bacterium HSG24]|nr:NUDIX hydrolase [Anaerolineales bacterium HSG24]